MGLTPEHLHDHLMEQLAFREDNPLSSLLGYFGFNESQLQQSMFPEIETGRKIEVVMMPKGQNMTDELQVKFMPTKETIKMSVPVPFHVGVSLLPGENETDSKQSPSGKGRYQVKATG